LNGPGAARNAIAAGVMLAALAALAFGATAPFIRMAGHDVGPLLTASLLYAGAFLGALPNPWASGASAPRMARTHLPRLALVAILGAAVAPTLLAVGLQRVSAVQGSLLLNLEAVFTILFAWLIAREPIGVRVFVAGGLMFVAGSVAVFGAGLATRPDTWGSLAVAGAVAAWAMDNVLTRPLAELSPASVVRAKAGFGVAMTATVGLVLGDRLPDARGALGLLLCGLTGYGLSLRLYLLAQRRIGAARTGSVFAIAPFGGAALALVMERRTPDWATMVSAALFGLGVYLHVTEKHGHVHSHHAVAHDHVHRHDDGHHDHHDSSPDGEHSHEHQHGPTTHEHQHAPDVHHEHDH